LQCTLNASGKAAHEAARRIVYDRIYQAQPPLPLLRQYKRVFYRIRDAVRPWHQLSPRLGKVADSVTRCRPFGSGCYTVKLPRTGRLVHLQYTCKRRQCPHCFARDTINARYTPLLTQPQPWLWFSGAVRNVAHLTPDQAHQALLEARRQLHRLLAEQKVSHALTATRFYSASPPAAGTQAWRVLVWAVVPGDTQRPPKPLQVAVAPDEVLIDESYPRDPTAVTDLLSRYAGYWATQLTESFIPHLETFNKVVRNVQEFKYL
jgi:hypothetical protein